MSDHYNLGFLHASRHMPADAPAKPKRAFEEYSAGYADGISERPTKTYDSNGKFIGVLTLNEIAPAAQRPMDTHAKREVKGIPPLVPGHRTHKPVTLATREDKVSRKQRGLAAGLTHDQLVARDADLRQRENALAEREAEIAKREATLTKQLKDADARAKHALLAQRHKQLNRLRKLRNAIVEKYTSTQPVQEPAFSNFELIEMQNAVRTTHVAHHAVTLTRMLTLLSDLATLHESEDAMDAITYAQHSLTLQLDGMKETLNA